MSHPYSFVKTPTFSNLPIAMVLSLLPVTFRIILVAASCGEVIAACSYEAVAKLRSDVVTWSWGVPKPQLDATGEVWKKDKNMTPKKQSLIYLAIKNEEFPLTFCHCQWCFSEAPQPRSKTPWTWKNWKVNGMNRPLVVLLPIGVAKTKAEWRVFEVWVDGWWD